MGEGSRGFVALALLSVIDPVAYAEHLDRERRIDAMAASFFADASPEGGHGK